MPVLEVTPGGGFVVRLTATEKLLSFHGDVVAGPEHVLHARASAAPLTMVRGWRWPGSYWPLLHAYGSWRRFGRNASRDFVAVRRSGPGVVVDLIGHEFDRVVVTVPDPAAVVRALV